MHTICATGSSKNKTACIILDAATEKFSFEYYIKSNYHVVLFSEAKDNIYLNASTPKDVLWSVIFINNGDMEGIDIRGVKYFLFLSDHYYWQCLPEKLLDILQLEVFLNQRHLVVLSENETLTIDNLIKGIEESITRAKFQLAQDIIGSYVNVLFTFIYLCYSKKNYAGNFFNQRIKHKTVKNFVELASQHYINHYTVKQYADILCTAPNYLNELCKKELSLAANSIPRHFLIAEAKRQLLFFEKDIKEVSYRLGFCSPSHFSYFFKKYTGFSPRRYQDWAL